MRKGRLPIPTIRRTGLSSGPSHARPPSRVRLRYNLELAVKWIQGLGGRFLQYHRSEQCSIRVLSFPGHFESPNEQQQIHGKERVTELLEHSKPFFFTGRGLQATLLESNIHTCQTSEYLFFCVRSRACSRGPRARPRVYSTLFVSCAPFLYIPIVTSN